ncbi:sugar transferase [bacterium]|nr:MAG: sugar transferase [bacterium]
MVKKKYSVVAYITCSSDVIMAIASFYAAYWLRGIWIFAPFEKLASISSYHWLLFFVVPVWPFLFYYLGAYRFSYSSSPARVIPRTWGAIFIGVLFLSALIFSLKTFYLSRLFLVTFVVIDILATTLARLLLTFASRRYREYPTNIVIAGDGDSAVKLAVIIKKHRKWGLNLLGFVSEKSLAGSGSREIERHGKVLGTLQDIPALIHSHVIDEVIFAVSKETLGSMEDVLLLLEDEGINTRVALDIFPHMIAKVHVDEIESVPLLTFTTIPSNEAALIVKRFIDIFISSVTLAVVSPLMLAVVIAIRLNSPGPAIFVQRRSGQNGRIFDFYKLRSMYKDADQRKAELERANEMDGPVFKIKSDPRITPIGRFIRRASIDELPQLWNVLKGDMSIVGPRPPVPAEVEKYERWQRRRLSMKPGITCLWQVSGRNMIKFNDWIRLDLEYIDNWSLWLDIKILLRTIPAVLTGKGAY